jgi:hypothetical protein
MPDILLEDIKFKNISTVAVAGNSTTRTIIAAMLEIYNAEVIEKVKNIDAYTIKTSVLKYIREPTPANLPKYLSTETAANLVAMNISEVYIKITLEQFKVNDYFLLELIAKLMEVEKLDTYDARNEIKRLLDAKLFNVPNCPPEFLLTNPVYAPWVDQIDKRSINIIEVLYTLHPERLGIIEILTEKDWEWDFTPIRAINAVFQANGNQQKTFLEENEIKWNLIERSHFDLSLNDSYCKSSSTGGAVVPTTSSMLTSLQSSSTGDMINSMIGSSLATSMLSSSGTGMSSAVGAITSGIIESSSSAISSTGESSFLQQATSLIETVSTETAILISFACLGVLAASVAFYRNRAAISNCLFNNRLFGVSFEKVGNENGRHRNTHLEMEALDVIDAYSSPSEEEDELDISSPDSSDDEQSVSRLVP